MSKRPQQTEPSAASHWIYPARRIYAFLENPFATICRCGLGYFALVWALGLLLGAVL
jgi:hypothetical protein